VSPTIREIREEKRGRAIMANKGTFENKGFFKRA
jgi:hypothetical protein